MIRSSITDKIIANNTIFLENEGNTAQEYIYFYFITPRIDGNLLDADTVVSGCSSKLVNPGENFSISICLDGVTPGIYWYKVWAYWGAERSDAADMFTAVAPAYPPSGGGGGTPSVLRYHLTIVCIDKQFNVVPGAFISIYDGVRLLGNAITDTDGKVIFNMPGAMTVRIVAMAERFTVVEKIIFVEGSMTETIQFGGPDEAAFPWWILILIGIGIITYYAYKKQKMSHKRKKNVLM